MRFAVPTNLFGRACLVSAALAVPVRFDGNGKLAGGRASWAGAETFSRGCIAAGQGAGDGDVGGGEGLDRVGTLCLRKRLINVSA